MIQVQYPPDYPYCGRVKYQPPDKLTVRASALAGAVDILKTREWFGSGGSAFQVVLARERVVELSNAAGWLGIRWQALEVVD
jgi:hypothetical protein